MSASPCCWSSHASSTESALMTSTAARRTSSLVAVRVRPSIVVSTAPNGPEPTGADENATGSSVTRAFGRMPALGPASSSANPAVGWFRLISTVRSSTASTVSIIVSDCQIRANEFRARSREKTTSSTVIGSPFAKLRSGSISKVHTSRSLFALQPTAMAGEASSSPGHTSVSPSKMRSATSRFEAEPMFTASGSSEPRSSTATRRTPPSIGSEGTTVVATAGSDFGRFPPASGELASLEPAQPAMTRAASAARQNRRVCRTIHPSARTPRSGAIPELVP